MNEWLRKNKFIRELRTYLKRFRIVDVKTEVLAEVKESDQNAFTGEKHFEPTGRHVIGIVLTGYWRQK